MFSIDRVFDQILRIAIRLLSDREVGRHSSQSGLFGYQALGTHTTASVEFESAYNYLDVQVRILKLSLGFLIVAFHRKLPIEFFVWVL